MTIQKHPASLIVGLPAQLQSHVEAMLQKAFCPRLKSSDNKDTGCFCVECRKIKNRQHPGFVWIGPEKSYTVDDIQIIFDRSKFALDDDQTFYFILENVQLLTTATANRLLKILEEPPQGYHFMLLTTNAESIVPTILSRCLVIELAPTQALSTKDEHPLLAYFYNGMQKIDPVGFEQELKKQALNDTQSLELLQRLIGIYTNRIRSNIQNGQEIAHDTKHTQEYLLKALRKPPQAGSSELFWKNLYLSFPRT